MKYIFLIVFSSLHVYNIAGQSLQPFHKKSVIIKKTPTYFFKSTSTEVCDNNIDDDNNGLTDQDDFACYFKPSSLLSCNQSSIIWACSADSGLYWVNLATGIESFVGNMNNTFGDLSWASNGKLYGMGGDPTGIWEIDPNTAVTRFLGTLPGGYSPVNAMTADGSGNLYLTASLPPFNFYIIKLNIIAWQVCRIADLTAANLSTGGDLTFLNGTLYLACASNVVARVDVRTGVLQPTTIINSAIDGYGLASIGDGYLYGSNGNKVYRLDPQTFLASSSPFYAFSDTNLILNGLANYSELCQAPQCTANLSIRPSSTPPYCLGKGIRLQANITCNIGQGTFIWTTPFGNTVNTDTLTALSEGMYYVRYHNPPDTCSSIDSFLLQYECPKITIHSSPPPYCRNIGVRLQANTTTCNALPDAFTWRTPLGSTVKADTLSAIGEGMYYVKYQTPGGTCNVIDSFFLKYESFPVINIGNDTSLCRGDQIYLSPHDTTGFTVYQWQDRSTGVSLLATSPGWYWLEASTQCGFIRDSIYIQPKTNGCEATVFVPSAFTPNSDGHNDMFKPVVNGTLLNYEFNIYNRWGQTIFKTRDSNNGWNGSVRGLKQDSGVYIWTCRYQFKGKVTEQKKGTVILLR